jgi:hypothetical protein
MRADLPDLLAELLVFPDIRQFLGGLEIHPELGRRAEELTEPDRHFRADTAFLQNDIVHRLRRNFEALRQSVAGDIERAQELFFEDFSGMDGPTC